MSNPFEAPSTLVAGMATLWSAAALAGLSAMMANATRPWVGGDLNAPFGRNFSMDIDPVTSWSLPGLFGYGRGSRQAEAFMEAFAQQQLLICAMIEECRAQLQAEGRTGEAAGAAEMRLSMTQFKQLEDATERVCTLSRRGRGG